jgi:hypothetical protein
MTKDKPVQRYNAHEGQMLILDGGTVGVDVPLEECFNEDWPEYVRRKRFNISDVRAAYEEGLSDAQNGGDRDKLFDDFVEKLLNRKQVLAKARPDGRLLKKK